jgi:hypothetical protein
MVSGTGGIIRCSDRLSASPIGPNINISIFSQDHGSANPKTRCLQNAQTPIGAQIIVRRFDGEWLLSRRDVEVIVSPTDRFNQFNRPAGTRPFFS